MSEPQEGQKPDRLAIARALAASAPHEPTGDFLNLSRRPFLNSRPVVRTALLLWLGGAVLAAVNVSSFWDYLSGSADKRARIQKGDANLAQREAAVRELEVRLDAYDLGANNQKVDFLNEKIAERTFSWSLLLERLADVLPNDVRLKRLQPVADEKVRSNASSGTASGATRTSKRIAADGAVPLSITAESRNFEALLRLQSNLFAHPAFRSYPNVSHQERNDDLGLITFDLTARYVPGGAPLEALKPTASAPARSAPGGAP